MPKLQEEGARRTPELRCGSRNGLTWTLLVYFRNSEEARAAQTGGRENARGSEAAGPSRGWKTFSFFLLSRMQGFEKTDIIFTT